MQQIIEREINFPHVSVQLATVNWGPDGEIVPPHTDYALCQRLSGNHSPLRVGNLSVKEAFPRVRSVAFLPPGCAVRLFPVEAPFRVINCFFRKGHFESTTEITHESWDRHAPYLVSIRNKRIEIMMQETYVELVQPGFGHDLLIEAASTMILVELARYAQQLDRKNRRSGASLALAPWQLRRVLERIKASSDMGYPNLGELAELCGISQSHLMRTFKASTGWQIHKYIAEERLNAAKQMLAEDRVSTKEVSQRLGFQSPAYFATAFRRMTGKTPTEYRSEVRARSIGDVPSTWHN